MWYRQTLAAYSTELGQLKDTLQGGIDPYDYTHRLPDYWQSTDQQDLYDQHAEEPWEWMEAAPPEQQDQFKQWLAETPDPSGSGGIDAPPYETMSYYGMHRPRWMTHFTDRPEQVADQGFLYGHPEISGVEQTRSKRDRLQSPGFNFAYPADSRDAWLSQQESSYGRHGVVFYGGAMDTHHHGDMENQSVFWGPSVDPRMIFPIRKDDNDRWGVFDDNDRELVSEKSYQEVVDWVKTNWKMLQAVKEKKTRRRRRGREA